jgi:hypothetical protein
MKLDAKNNLQLRRFLWCVNVSIGDIIIDIVHVRYLVEFPGCLDAYTAPACTILRWTVSVYI